MKLSEYIDSQLEKGVYDIIYQDEQGRVIEINCDHIDMKDVLTLNI